MEDEQPIYPKSVAAGVFVAAAASATLWTGLNWDQSGPTGLIAVWIAVPIAAGLAYGLLRFLRDLGDRVRRRQETRSP